MSWLPSYSLVLLIFTAVALLLVALFLLRRRWLSRSPLQRYLEREGEKIPPQHSEFFASILVLEQHYPSFVAILLRILERFPLGRFLNKQEFRDALTYLRDSVFEPPAPSRLIPAMCQIVRTFLEDADVEEQCGVQISGLVDEFLKEIGPYSPE